VAGSPTWQAHVCQCWGMWLDPLHDKRMFVNVEVNGLHSSLQLIDPLSCNPSRPWLLHEECAPGAQKIVLSWTPSCARCRDNARLLAAAAGYQPGPCLRAVQITRPTRHLLCAEDEGPCGADAVCQVSIPHCTIAAAAVRMTRLGYIPVPAKQGQLSGSQGSPRHGQALLGEKEGLLSLLVHPCHFSMHLFWARL